MLEIQNMTSKEWTAAVANPRSNARRVVEFWRQSFGYDRDDWPYTDQGNTHIIGIEHGCAVCYCKIDITGGHNHLNDLCVSPRCRNIGIGSRFVQLLKNTYRPVYLEIDRLGDKFEILLKWYIKLGFNITRNINTERYCTLGYNG